MSVSLRDVVLAVRYGDAALVGESAGYAILGAADLALRSRQLATIDSVGLTADGVITLEGAPCSAEEAEAGLRSLLALLLSLVRTPAPNLARVAARGTSNGILGLVQELEAALVPVNRKAARRTLARLERETKKSAALGRDHVRVEPVEVALPEPPPPSPLSELVQFEEPPVLWEPEPVDVEQPRAAWHPEPIQVEPIQVEPMQVELEPVYVEPEPDLIAPEVPRTEARAASPGLASSMAHVSRMAHGAAWGAQIPVTTEENPQVRGGSAGPLPPPVAIQEVTQRPRFQSPSARRDPEIYLEPDAFHEEDDLDEVPTQVFVGAMAQVSEPQVTGQLALPREARPAPLRRRAPYVARPQRVIADDVCLVSSSRMVQKRRLSDISELLDKMRVEPKSPDEVFQGLKSLSRVEVSPLAPPVGAAFIDDDSRASR